MHFFIWMGAVVTSNSLRSNVSYDMFPQVGLGEIPVKLECRDIAALNSFDIFLLNLIYIVQDSIVIMEF